MGYFEQAAGGSMMSNGSIAGGGRQGVLANGYNFDTGYGFDQAAKGMATQNMWDHGFDQQARGTSLTDAQQMLMMLQQKGKQLGADPAKVEALFKQFMGY